MLDVPSAGAIFGRRPLRIPLQYSTLQGVCETLSLVLSLLCYVTAAAGAPAECSNHDVAFALLGEVAHCLCVNPAQRKPRRLLSLRGRCYGTGYPAALIPKRPRGELHLEFVFGCPLLKQQPFDFACVSGSASTFWCLGVGEPKVLDLPIWVGGSCCHVGLTYLLTCCMALVRRRNILASVSCCLGAYGTTRYPRLTPGTKAS